MQKRLVQLATMATMSAAALALPTSALASGRPHTGTIVINQSMAGADIIGSKARVNSAWGTPSCKRGSNQCFYLDPVSGAWAEVIFDSHGNSEFMSEASPGYTTSKGIGVGSSQAALNAAYGSQLTTCASYVAPCILGTANGVPVETVFQITNGSVSAIIMARQAF